MIPILFYGVEHASSFGSIVALEWLAEPYRLCRIKLPEQSQSAAFKSINPVGEVPTLVTDTGDVLTESVAILTHISGRGLDKNLGYQQGTAAFDRFIQVLAFLSSRYFSAYNPLWYGLEFADAAEKQSLRDEGRALAVMAHVKLEALLGDREWLMGDRMSLAEPYLAGIARWNEVHDILNLSDYPRIARLLEKSLQDPALAFARAIEEGDAPKGIGAFQGHIALDRVAECLPPKKIKLGCATT